MVAVPPPLGIASRADAMDMEKGEQPAQPVGEPPAHMRMSRQSSRGSIASGKRAGGHATLHVSASSVLRMLAPKCNAAVFGRLIRERVRTAADLASLDKDDLRDLGLTMVERGRVLRWSREAFPTGGGSPGVSPDTSPGTPGYGFGMELCSRARPPWVSDDVSAATRSPSTHEEEFDDHGKKLEQAEFWCSLVSASTPIPRRRSVVQSLRDVRENVLEERFDVTSERVAEVYNDMHRSSLSPDGAISMQELGQGLRRCGLVGFDDAALTQVIKVVKLHDGTGGLKLAEFETILSRLKLAQLFVSPVNASSPNASANSLVSYSPSWICLRVVDYNSHQYQTMDVTESRFRDFCFGHRIKPASPHETPFVRWVHLTDFDLTTLLCLTVKYSLHPLGVEDVIDQCPTKIDRYGCNYFAAVEQLCLVGDARSRGMEGAAPVKVAGFHVSAFCSGPPLFDTVITVAQPDQSFADDWPGGADLSGASGQCWAEKLRARLTSTPRSRLRERRADFILYQVMDLSTDELQAVIRAYTARLVHLEACVERFMNGPYPEIDDPCAEASTCRLQLKVIMRRVRGLQRMLRHSSSDPDFTTELHGYLQDVAEHLDEAHEDASHLVEKCTAVLEAHHRAVERRDEKLHQSTADRLNKTLFVLTVGTFIFAPMQFLAAVYGMNFVNKDGEPTMPELLWKNGYLFFWIITAGYLFLALCFTAWWYYRIQRRSAEDASEEARKTNHGLDGLQMV